MKAASMESAPSATKAPVPPRRAARLAPVDLVLIVFLLPALVALWQARSFEVDTVVSSPVWWDGEGYRELARNARGIDRAIFLSDRIDASTNTRLHSIQYAIIPGILDTELDWPVVFRRLDAGEYLICDFSDPKVLDQEIAKFRDWGIREKREVMVDRVSRNIAIMRAGERP
ncbi:MAG: hypothetical protein H6807_00435 [Planctomycetes bacterium]|nr:hypothetical protein [Planctomycetota bacterium]